jgi:hypothetical protein
MNAKKGLTSFREGDDSDVSVRTLLAEAGLELWQAPEGFWAIRVKPPAATMPLLRVRRRRLEGQA